MGLAFALWFRLGRRSRAWSHSRRWIGTGLALVALTGCEDELTEQECAQIVDRYTELLLRTRKPDASADEVLKLQRRARSRAVRNPRFSECRERFSRRAYRCAVQEATSADELERCLM
jgi:hypothetical protein